MKNIHRFKSRAIELGGPGIFKRSALHIRDGAGVFESLLAGGKYKTVLEIGTYCGVSTAFIAQFVDKVITIDLCQGRLEQTNRKFDREAFWKGFGLRNIELHLVWDDFNKARLVKGLNFDFAFIDAGKDNIDVDFNIVKRCGTVLFHDYDDRGVARKNVVYNFVNSLPKWQVKTMDIFALWCVDGH